MEEARSDFDESKVSRDRGRFAPKDGGGLADQWGKYADELKAFKERDAAREHRLEEIETLDAPDVGDDMSAYKVLGDDVPEKFAAIADEDALVEAFDEAVETAKTEIEDAAAKDVEPEEPAEALDAAAEEAISEVTDALDEISTYDTPTGDDLDGIDALAEHVAESLRKLQGLAEKLAKAKSLAAAHSDLQERLDEFRSTDFEKRFDPSQPRDDSGRFGEGGGSSAPVTDSQAADAAKGWGAKLAELPAKVATLAKDTRRQPSTARWRPSTAASGPRQSSPLES